MKIKDVLAKVAKGETLTDEEKKLLADYDPEKAVNDAVAAYRRKADEKTQQLEADRDELKTQMEAIQAKLAEKDNSGKSERQKLEDRVKTLSDQLAAMNKKLEDADKEKATLARSAEVQKLREKAGIKFVPGVSEEVMSGAFAAAFNGIQDLNDENVVKPILEAFRAANKAVIADASGHGSGSQSHTGGGQFDAANNPFAEKTFNLTKQSELLKTNPVEAKRLAAAAGVTIAE